MLFRLASVVNDSIVDGPGFRLAVFFQGCPHRCPGCHNPQTHDPLGGRQADTAEILALAASNPLLDGITLTGGEPLCQPEAALELAMAAKKAGLTVMLYTGYLYEDIINDEAVMPLLKHTDWLVDGPFIQAERTLDMRFRGSKNQRLIDVRQSLAAGKAIPADL